MCIVRESETSLLIAMNTIEYEFPPDYHFGHLAFERLGQYPDRVCQIDAATGAEESYESVLKRSIKLAQALRAFGLNPGDVMAIGGLNHLDICIPHFAALFNGLPIVGVDPNFKFDELRRLFEITRPKIAFCQNKSYDVYAKAAADLRLDVKLVAFDEGECTMKKFMEIYETLEPVEDFKVAEYDLDKIYPFLICTSGTTGKLKVAAFKNKQLLIKIQKYQSNEPSIMTRLVLSPVNWISFFFAPITVAGFGGIRLQTSNPDNEDHIIEMINKYRPEIALLSPAHVARLLARHNEVDLTCFKIFTVTGNKLYQDIQAGFKKLLSSNCMFMQGYGQTEMIGPVLTPSPSAPLGSSGRPTDLRYNVKLVDPDTGVEIKEPNVAGEMLVKGPGFSGYYNDPVETANWFTEDGFFKTGDLMYRDKDDNYYFVERLKSLMKYRNSHIYPAELEEVIHKHSGVKDVCVVGIDDPVDGQRPVACVVRHGNSEVTAQEIKDLIAGNYSKNKELRGGVVFLDSLPYTSTGKIIRSKLREIVVNAKRE